MKINKFVKKKNEKYELVLDNNHTLEVFQDVILKYDLLLKKEIDKKTLEKISIENNYYEAYYLSIKYISRKIRCEKEIYDYLKSKDFSNEVIEKVIIDLRNKQLLNDINYIESFTRDKFNLNNLGPNKIKSDLYNLKIDKSLIEKYVVIDDNEMKEKLDKLIDKRIKQLKNYSGEILRRKVEEYFIIKGFDKTMINSILIKKNLENDDKYKIEYDKLYKKYSKKYSGAELDYIIKQKLYLKGFKK